MRWIPIQATLLALALTALVHGQQWGIEFVDRSGVGNFTALKIDTQGNAHLAYVVDNGQGGHTLKYAFRDAEKQRWFSMVLAEDASFCDLALDSKGRPHISWADFGTQSGAKLRYANWDGAEWQKRVVSVNSTAVGYYTSIALDPNDRPTISFYELRGPQGALTYRMRTVMWNGKYWEARTIDYDELSGKFNAIAGDSHGGMHLAFANVDAMAASVRYAYWDGRSWKREMVDGRQQNGGELVGYSVGIALDAKGQPHLSYVNYSTPTLKYAVRRDGKWQVQAVDRMAVTAYPDRNSIVVDDDGRPYLGYFDQGPGILKVAWPEGSKWAVEVVDRNTAGFTSSMQIHKGVLWISYADQATGGVKVARRNLPGLPEGKAR